jgi:hypothetical protein
MNLGGIDFNISAAIDFLLKLAPAASIIAAIIAARITFRNNRRLNAETIAKNHYREMLELFLKNSDVLYLGANRDSYSRLKADLQAYRRYRMLFTVMCFAMQELYLAMDLKHEKNWEQMIRVFILFFKWLIISETDYPPFLHGTLDRQFLTFMFATAREYEPPWASMDVSRNVAR